MGKLKRLLIAGALVAGTFLPMNSLEAGLSEDIPKKEIKTEEKDKMRFNIGANLENESKLWGISLGSFPTYDQSAGINYGNLSASVTGTLDITKKELYSAFTHVGYFQPLSENTSAIAGVMAFRLNFEEDWSNAAVGYLGLVTTFPLNPSITYNKLFGFGGGEYIEGSLSKQIPLTDKFNLDISGRLGYNMNLLREGKGFSHIQGNISVPIKLGKISINPYLNYFVPLSEDFESGFTGGVSAGMNF